MADTASGIGTWLGFAVTAAGLSGLISQANAISNKLDPFHSHRTEDYLGVWYQCQEASSWWTVMKPPLCGPKLTADLKRGFCGHRDLHLTRLNPATPPPPGQAGWAVICAVIFPMKSNAALYPLYPTPNSLEKAKRDGLNKMQLMRYSTYACVSIPRTAFITMLLLTNARAAFSFSDASGFRAGYPSYFGQWYVNWPSGLDAVVRFSFHDYGWLEQNAKSYPESFLQRPDRCIQMLAGVIEASGFRLAFCGRQPPGFYVLECLKKGYSSAHGSRHLYNIMGGKVNEVDYLFARRISSCSDGKKSSPNSVDTGDTNDANDRVSNKIDGVCCNAYEESSSRASTEDLELKVQSTDKDSSKYAIFKAPEDVQTAIKGALDCLPWNFLSWSIHRGMRDILLAYSKPTMDRLRPRLASLLKDTCNDSNHLWAFRQQRGWIKEFVSGSMGEKAESAILLGGGDSGDSVRIVTDTMWVLASSQPNFAGVEGLDEVDFWRRPDELRQASDDVEDLTWAVALTKIFVLEWSIDFDYQMYHNLPINLKFA